MFLAYMLLILTRAVLKGLVFGKFVFDVFFYIYVGIDSVDLTGKRVCEEV